MISQLIFLFILILLNAYFAATEIAFISLMMQKSKNKQKMVTKKQNKFKKCLKTQVNF